LAAVKPFFGVPREPRAEPSAPSAVGSGLREAASTTRPLEIVKLVDVEAMPEELQIIPSKFADTRQLTNLLKSFPRVQATHRPIQRFPERVTLRPT